MPWQSRTVVLARGAAPLEEQAFLSGRGELRDGASGAEADEIVVGLKGEPELRGGPEGTGEQPGGFWGYTSLAADELVDPLDGYTQVLSEGDLGYAQRLEELLAENLARMGGYALPRQHHGYLSGSRRSRHRGHRPIPSGRRSATAR